MRHIASTTFWECYKQLPESVQDLADKNFKLLKDNPKHPSLHLKKVRRYYSARVGRKYRTLSVEVEDTFIWFWIGTHAEYDRLVE